MNTTNQYVFGGISGMFGILLSYPLDTIKTHIQNGNSLASFKPTIGNAYRGISVPLIGVGIEKAIVFGTYNAMMQTTECIPLSGAIAGLTASLIVSPYERLKILKQSSQTFTIKYADVINPRFMFKGLSVTFTREVPGFAIYFSVYEYLKKKNYTNHNKEITGVSSFLYGGLSGLISWCFIFPQDKIKTIMQSNFKNSIFFDKSFSYIIKNIYNKYGIMHFYKGFSWAAGRAILLHSGTFFMMESLNGKKALDTIY